MKLETKRYVIAGLAGLFLLSLIFVQWMEVARKQEEAGVRKPHISVPASRSESGVSPCSLRTSSTRLACIERSVTHPHLGW